MNTAQPSSLSVDIDPTALREAAKRADVVAAMERFYERVEQRITALAPTCWNKGECCRFAQFGHRLYVTALEVVYYLAKGEAAAGIPEGVCPHAHDGKCHARDRRPLGCRLFYCDPNAQQWQGPLSEFFLQELRNMHQELGVDYFYAEWLHVLRILQSPQEAYASTSPHSA